MAVCANCSNFVAEQAKFCPTCGAEQPQRPAGAQPPMMPGVPLPQASYGGAYAQRRTEGSAIASLVLGIAGFLFCPLVCSILAIIFGNQAKSKIAVDPSLEGEGMAKAGVILGWIGIAYAIIMVIVFVGLFQSVETVNFEPTPTFPG